ncbi:putative baseplate assembly protein [Streptomyces mirabilis]|uniref:putative baseplate assembly protein n=1 Tax=Streptomyces mirabilis TaxID=68239 RepID=UPI0036CE312B
MTTRGCGTPGSGPDDRARRARVRREEWYGLDGVDPDPDDPRTLVVRFLGRAPEPLTTANFRIEGGRRVTGIAVTDVRLPDGDEPGAEERVLLTTDRVGDLSPYTLYLLDVPRTDPCFARAPLSYAALCSAATDRAPREDLVSWPPEPDVSYLAKDYDSFRRLLLDRLALIMPDWTERHVPDLGVTLVELLAYVGDHLSYHQDAVATEAYLGTARRRVSVRRHARLVDHRMHDGCNARTWVCVEVERALTLPAADVRFATEDGDVVFEPVTGRPLRLLPAHNAVRFWTWGSPSCSLPAGATSATLVDDGLQLRPGDVLVLEESRDPDTLDTDDADPTHRHPVRLLTVRPTKDELYDRAVVEVTWAPEDAPADPLVLTVADGCGGATECALARGNTVLVDHGDSGDTPGPPTGPVTRREVFPRPRVVGRSQAAALRTVPDRARRRLAELHARTGDGHLLEAAELAELRVLFGARTLRRRRFPQPRPRSRRQPTASEQAAALQELLDAWPRLLAVKTRWLHRLAHRARAGLVLTDLELTEIREAWGPAYADGLAAGEPAHAGPAREALAQDPREALPVLRLESPEGSWTPRHDLLASGPDDLHFVAETDDDGDVHPRFGDDTLGRALPAGSTLRAVGRTGNGTAGNLGAGALTRITSRTSALPEVRRVHNPMPATGGTDPETSAEVRRLAPGAFRHDLKRAVTAADYATLAGQVPGVQLAVARLRWNGSWYEAQVAVDPLRTENPVPDLVDRVREELFARRRTGHGLDVRQARYVPLKVGLRLCVLPHHDPATVTRAVRAAFARYFDPDRLTFGTRVDAAPLVALAQAVPGVESVHLNWLERLDEPDEPHRPQKDVPLRPLEVPRLDDDPAAPENGVLDLRTGDAP